MKEETCTTRKQKGRRERDGDGSRCVREWPPFLYIHARTLPRPLGKQFLVNERDAEGLEPKPGIQSCQRRKEGNNENTIRTKRRGRGIYSFKNKPCAFIYFDCSWALLFVITLLCVRLTIFVFIYLFFLFPRRILSVFHYFDIYDDIIAPAVSLFAFLFPVFIFLLTRFADHLSSSSFLFVLFPLLILGDFSVGTESNLPATG